MAEAKLAKGKNGVKPQLSNHYQITAGQHTSRFFFVSKYTRLSF
jgi:hypothetical protein